MTTTFRQIRQKIEKANNYLQVKRQIVDNFDKLDKEEKEKIFEMYKKKFGEDEFWFLLRAIYNITKEKIE